MENKPKFPAVFSSEFLCHVQANTLKSILKTTADYIFDRN